MELTSLNAISPIDGRYAEKTAELRPLFSEYGMMRFRVQVEIKWLQTLSFCKAIRDVPELSKAAIDTLDNIAISFSEEDGAHIKEIENTTNHDVKAVEYFLKEKIKGNKELEKVSEFFHFACTSEDINNLSHALMLKEAQFNIVIPVLKQLDLAMTCRYSHVVPDSWTVRFTNYPWQGDNGFHLSPATPDKTVWRGRITGEIQWGCGQFQCTSQCLP
jgi:adenylosuccinate lyase